MELSEKAIGIGLPSTLQDLGSVIIKLFSCMVKLWSTYRVKVAQCMGSPLF